MRRLVDKKIYILLNMCVNYYLRDTLVADDDAIRVHRIFIFYLIEHFLCCYLFTFKRTKQNIDFLHINKALSCTHTQHKRNFFFFGLNNMR